MVLWHPMTRSWNLLRQPREFDTGFQQNPGLRWVVLTWCSCCCKNICNIYIYIPVIIPVRRWSQWGGLGWGGVGWWWWRSLHMNTSLMLRRWCRSLHMNTSLMLRRWCRSLRMNTSLMLRRTGVGWGGVGMMTFLAHEHIFDATEMMSFLAETTFERSQSFDQSFHTHMQILERSFECTACENFAGACKQKRQFGETIQTQVFRGRWWQAGRE